MIYKAIALMLWDYGTPILLTVLLWCVLFLALVYRKKAAHKIRMLWKWLKAYADAISKTFDQESAKSPRQRKIERLQERENAIRAKREDLQMQNIVEHLERMFEENE